MAPLLMMQFVPITLSALMTELGITTVPGAIVAHRDTAAVGWMRATGSIPISMAAWKQSARTTLHPMAMTKCA
jgi:hypothetical protein